MDIAVPSRFACLKIEDDDFRPAKSKDSKKKVDVKQGAKKQEKGSKQNTVNNNVKKSGSKPQQQQQPQNNVAKKPKKKPQSAKQWEEWKEKDSELVNGNFEQDLQNAILLSKLDYEEKKDMYKQFEKDLEKKGDQSNKKKKNKVMSLEQFLGNNENNAEKIDAQTEEDAKIDDKFFERVQQEAREELTKEQVLQKRKEREANIEEIITIAHYQQKLEKEIEKNAVLQVELDKAKKEIAAVKSRNKTLCGILGHGEMKDKADVLVELERLNIVKNELTEEVSRLHVLLEQERSKVAALTSDSQHKTKDKKQKKNNHSKN